MARKFVISLVVLAFALLTYAPVGGSSMAMAAGSTAAMGDCPMPESDCCDDGKRGAAATCAMDDRCLASCAFAASFPNFHLMASATPFGPSPASSMIRPVQDGLTTALGFPPFRPPRHSSLA